ncbi:MAG TPA: DUF433 domain-containing protein [Thermoanaerobaculia bacterium]|jgi:uncharacterized protein (DUF433 family)
MKRIPWQQRIVADPEIHHGEPCIAGTRIPVRMIVGSLADGLTIEQIVAEYPQLTSEDVLAALAYAAEVLHQESLLPLTA